MDLSRDINFVIMEKLDDRSLISLCKTHKYAKLLCDNETFWRNRLLSKYPDSLQFKSDGKKWKVFYMEMIYYINKEKERKKELEKMRNIFYYDSLRDGETQIYEAAKDGNIDIINYYLSKFSGFNFIYMLNWGLNGAVESGNIKLAKYLIEKGAIPNYTTLNYAKHNKDMILFLNEPRK